MEDSKRPFYPEAWGAWLLELREGQGWTQLELALKIGLKDASLISRWERGEADKGYSPSLYRALELAKVFAGRPGGLRRPMDVVDWLGLIGIIVSEAELAHMASGEQWRAALASPRVSRYQVPALPTPYVERTGLLARAREGLLNEASGRAPLVWFSVPHAPGATVRAAGGWRRWLAAGWQEFRDFRHYEEVIMEGWDPQDVPLERWIALMRLQRRYRAYRQRWWWLGSVVLAAMGALLGLCLVPASWLREAGFASWYLADVFFAIGLGGVSLAFWLGTVLMIDLHRLRNWH